MTIQCRTGCGEQITYERYDFPDGFVYFLPLNLDETIHDCPNVPHNLELKINEIFLGKDNIVEYQNPWKHEDMSVSQRYLLYFLTTNYEDKPDNYIDEYFSFELNVIHEWEKGFSWEDSFPVEEISNELKKQGLIAIQTQCLLFPSPFMGDYEYNTETKERYSNLNKLSRCYESLGEYKSAIRAREIQDRITDDQSKKIVELYEKSNSFESKLLKKNFKVNITATEFLELIDKVENVIKSFIRKMYPDINELQKDFPELCSKANELKVNDSKEIKRDNDDVIEFLTFGASVKILKINRRNKEKWSPIENFVIDYAYKIVDIRNMFRHYSDGRFETAITEHKKAKIQIYAIDLLEFFQKWDYR